MDEGTNLKWIKRAKIKKKKVNGNFKAKFLIMKILLTGYEFSNNQLAWYVFDTFHIEIWNYNLSYN